MTRLPKEQTSHTCPICDRAKNTSEGFSACFRCRNIALKRCVQHKRSFGGFCIKGLYEYCRPVVRGSEVLSVIFIGNILSNNKEQHFTLRKHFDESLLETMQTNFSEKDCIQTADLLESYILHLLDKYGDTPRQPTDALIENIKNYIAENLLYDFSMSNLSAVFNYNEKYLGRLFKKQTGLFLPDYVNERRIERAKDSLNKGEYSITQVSLKIRIDNVPYFNRLFKKMVGIIPSEYRKNQISSAF
jgi:two-component system response regulator YesN